MRRPIVLGLLALALPLTGCIRDPDPVQLDEDAVAVHALLETGADTALVVISRATSSAGGASPLGGVSEAEVRLIAHGDTAWLAETPGSACIEHWSGTGAAGRGCYRGILATTIASGDAYQLEIRLPDNTRVTGSTVVPEPVELSAPAPDLRVTASCRQPDYCYGEQTNVWPYTLPVVTIPVEWEEPPFSVAATVATLRPVAVYYDDVEYPGHACTLGHYGAGPYGAPSGSTRDGVYAVPNIGCRGDLYPALEPARFDSIRAELSVIGLNEAYYEHLVAGSWQGIRAASASHGIEGAFGVFGALSRASRTVLLVREAIPEPPGPVVGN